MVSARNVQTRLLAARRRPRRERYGRTASAERSRCVLFAGLEGRFRCFPRKTHLKMLLTGTPPPPSGPIWARRGAPATRRTRPRRHHARSTRTPTPNHVPSPRVRGKTAPQCTRGAVRRRAQHDHGRRPYAPILRRPASTQNAPQHLPPPRAPGDIATVLGSPRQVDREPSGHRGRRPRHAATHRTEAPAAHRLTEAPSARRRRHAVGGRTAGRLRRRDRGGTGPAVVAAGLSLP